MTIATGEQTKLDLDLLFRLRLVVGRIGEMDNAGWWNIRGLLATNGAFVLGRGFPRTHLFAQARTVFAVASQRCRHVFTSDGVATLWHVHADVEDAFEDHWPLWIDRAEEWTAHFIQATELRGHDVLGALSDLGLADEAVLAAARKLRRSEAGNAIQLPSMPLNNRALVLLAAGFAQAEPGRLAVPYL